LSQKKFLNLFSTTVSTSIRRRFRHFIIEPEASKPASIKEMSPVWTVPFMAPIYFRAGNVEKTVQNLLLKK